MLAKVRLVAGDIYVLLTTVGWSFNSWLLSQSKEPVRDPQ